MASSSGNVGVMSIVLELNAANYSDAISEAQRKINSLAGASQKAGTSTVSSMRAASAAIREMNGDFTNNIRAVEAFASNTLGLGGVFQKIFPVAGGIAFAAVIGEGIKKLIDMKRAADEVPRAIMLGFRQAVQAQMLSNDELRVANDKLDDQIAKLEHKPQNALAETLDEARVKADQLADSLARDSRSLEDLLKKNQNGFFAGLLGRAPTAGVANAANNYFNDMQDFGYQKQMALNSGDAAGAARFQSQMDARTAWEKARLAQEIGVRTMSEGDRAAYAEFEPNYAGDQTANLQILRGEQGLLATREDAAKLDTQNAQKESQLKKLQDAKDAAAAVKEADRQRFEAMKEGLEQQKLLYGKSEALAQDYWQKMYAMTSAKKDPGLLALITPELVSSQHALAVELARGWEEVRQQEQRVTEGVEEAQGRMRQEAERQVKEAFAATSEGISADFQKQYEALVGADRAREFGLSRAGAGDAARQMQTMHDSEFALRKNQLGDELTRVTSSANPAAAEEKKRQAAAIQKEIDELNRQHDLQVAEDDARIRSTTLLGGMNDALLQFARTTTDAGAVLSSVFMGGLDATNNAIVRTLTTPGSTRRGQHVFGQVGHEVFTSATSSLLKYGEGKLLGGLLGKKADGSTEAQALWVRMAGAGKGAWGAVTGVLSKIGGGFGGFLSKALPFLTGMIPGFAGGVEDFGGGLAMVGEQGPELVQLPPHSNVVPNGDLSGMGGDTHIHNNLHFHGDNWNENDVDKRIGKALRAAAPHIASATLQHIQSENRRYPPGRSPYQR